MLQVKPLDWKNDFPETHGYPDYAVDALGGRWTRWFIDGQQYFTAPNQTHPAGRAGCADMEYENRIWAALEQTE